MGNRSRFIAVSAAAASAALIAARRRARRHAAADGIREAIMPTRAVDAPAEWVMPPDPGHAPGHRHLSRREARMARRRGPWNKYGYGQRYPYARD